MSPTNENTPIRETAYSDALRVDRAAGVIRGAKILGRESRNGRTYSDAALQQAAALYEGVGVNVDHPPTPGTGDERRLADGFGHLQNVACRGDGVYGDLVFLRSHALAEQVCEAAERMPGQFGLSHDAEGHVVNRDGKWLVESITKVRSVDLVRNPATNRGLFESQQRSTTGETTAVLTILNEGQLEDAEKVRRVRALITNPAAADSTDNFGNSVGNADGSDGHESRAAHESLREAVLRLERRMQARDLLDEYGISPDPVLTARLRSLDDEHAMRSLLESWTAGTRLPLERPQSRPPQLASRRLPFDPADKRAVTAFLRN